MLDAAEIRPRYGDTLSYTRDCGVEREGESVLDFLLWKRILPFAWRWRICNWRRQPQPLGLPWYEKCGSENGVKVGCFDFICASMSVPLFSGQILAGLYMSLGIVTTKLASFDSAIVVNLTERIIEKLATLNLTVFTSFGSIMTYAFNRRN